MLYGRGFYSQAVLSRQLPGRGDTGTTHLPATTVREDVAMLLRLGAVVLLAVSAAAAVIGFAQ
ncbi:hypothetical protein LP421_13025 [Rhizobium sp. RCAM05350]|nr:hypothetical protein LP421_13025 [Rhizobium sp. RCAM05350]